MTETEIGALAGAIVIIANFITALTPTRSRHPAVDKLLRALNWISINVGKNKNADDVEPAKA